jgi:hypothetical protein
MNERRSHIRRRTFKGGKLIFNKGLSVLDCVIRDMSDHGARVELGTTIGVPDTFELIIAPDRVKRSCKIAWRSKRRSAFPSDDQIAGSCEGLSHKE